MAKAKREGLYEVTKDQKKEAAKYGFKKAEPTINAKKAETSPAYVSEFQSKHNEWAEGLFSAIASGRAEAQAKKENKEFVQKNILPYAKKSKKSGGISGAKKGKKGIGAIAKKRSVR